MKTNVFFLMLMLIAHVGATTTVPKKPRVQDVLRREQNERVQKKAEYKCPDCKKPIHSKSQHSMHLMHGYCPQVKKAFREKMQKMQKPEEIQLFIGIDPEMVKAAQILAVMHDLQYKQMPKLLEKAPRKKKK